MGSDEIRQFYQVDQTSTNVTETAMQQMNLSDHAYHYILKQARTVADLSLFSLYEVILGVVDT